jgi:hypothetical protein
LATNITGMIRSFRGKVEWKLINRLIKMSSATPTIIISFEQKRFFVGILIVEANANI